MSARKGHNLRKTVPAWAIWAPTYGILDSSIRHSRGAAIRSVWNPDHWKKLYRQGWRIVRVEVTAIYYSSNSAKMKKV